MNGPEDRPWPGADKPHKNYKKLLALLCHSTLASHSGLVIHEEDIKDAGTVTIWKDWDTKMIHIRLDKQEEESNG